VSSLPVPHPVKRLRLNASTPMVAMTFFIKTSLRRSIFLYDADYPKKFPPSVPVNPEPAPFYKAI
jgi:hypothetical protein